MHNQREDTILVVDKKMERLDLTSICFFHPIYQVLTSTNITEKAECGRVGHFFQILKTKTP
jgi:hypothetical protein